MTQIPGPKLTKVQIVEAARALEAWLESQDIQGPDRMFVVAYFMGFEIVTRGGTAERIQLGFPLATNLVRKYTEEIFAVAIGAKPQ